MGNLKLQIDSLNLLSKKVHLGDLNFEDSKIYLSKDKKGFNYQFLMGITESETDSVNQWHLTFHNLYIRNSNLKYKDLTTEDTQLNGINFNDINLSKLNPSSSSITCVIINPPILAGIYLLL